jgi:hypothetical protein
VITFKTHPTRGNRILVIDVGDETMELSMLTYSAGDKSWSYGSLCLASAELRQIADKLDELNGGK